MNSWFIDDVGAGNVRKGGEGERRFDVVDRESFVVLQDCWIHCL
jgi:hypothetical protein